MKHYQYILFDLDGTLTDSGEGITKSAQHALKHFGIEEDNLQKLEHFVGPPLGESFEKSYGFDPEKQKEAIRIFRERYNDIGVFENKLYPGIASLLAECKAEGVKLAIASSKPMHLVEKVLKHFDIWQYFDVKVGSLLDGTRETKEDVMHEVMHRFFGAGEIPKEQILMVGDRKFDVLAAQKFGIDCLAVTYGYAPEGELRACHPTYMADDIMQMRRVMLGHQVSQEEIARPAIRKSIDILMPLFLYWLVSGLVVSIGATLVGIAALQGDDTARTISANSTQIAVYLSAIAAVCTYPVTLFLYRKSVTLPMSQGSLLRARKRLIKWTLPIVVCSAVLSVGLNLLFAQIPFLQDSGRFQETANVQYSVSIVSGVIIFGLIVPIAEELVFRGVLYNRIKRSFGVELAIVLSALIFGLYHGNIVQFLYATILGLVMAYLYEKCELLLAPILFHCAANTVVFVVSKLSM